MQLNDKEIIERVLSHNNYEMWQKCELLKKVINATIEVKEGRGKNVRITNKYKHNVPTEVRQKIVDSCEYYKKLMEKKEIGSLEITKYKFEYVNGEPKIIIEMVKVLDKNGKYIKFAKLEGVTAFLSKYPVKFKEI